MIIRHTLAAAITAIALLTVTGCAVTRDQQSVGAYVDDSVITAAIKGRMVDNPNVDAASISVETMKGTVMLTGFAKNSAERTNAEALTWKVGGVKAVKNEIALQRP
jgi:hyperosmotically inducible protein